jgi:hypothetical protein
MDCSSTCASSSTTTTGPIARAHQRSCARATPKAVKLFAHVLATELLWLDRITHKPQRCPVWPEWTLAECARRLDEVRSSWREFLRFLESPQLGDTSDQLREHQGPALPVERAGHRHARALTTRPTTRSDRERAERGWRESPPTPIYIHAVREGCFELRRRPDAAPSGSTQLLLRRFGGAGVGAGAELLPFRAFARSAHRLCESSSSTRTSTRRWGSTTASRRCRRC